MKSRAVAVLVPLLVALGAPPAAAQIDITFDGIPFGTLLDGYTIQGVTFGYTGARPASFDVGSGPGCLFYVCDPTAEGDTEDAVLTMTFAQGLGAFEFGLATSRTTTSTVRVTPYSIFGVALGSSLLTLAPIVNFSEGLYTYGGPEAIGSVVVELGIDPDIGVAFALDNIRGSVVPEPATVLLLGTGLLGMGMAARRRRREGSIGA